MEIQGNFDHKFLEVKELFESLHSSGHYFLIVIIYHIKLAFVAPQRIM